MIFSHASRCITKVQQHYFSSPSCVLTRESYFLVIQSLEGLTTLFKSWIDLCREHSPANIIVVFVNEEDRMIYLECG